MEEGLHLSGKNNLPYPDALLLELTHRLFSLIHYKKSIFTILSQLFSQSQRALNKYFKYM